MTGKEQFKRSPLYELELAAGAKMVEFGGWEMPLQFSGIISEHNRVRQAAGVFDVSHMGRMHVTGPQAGPFLHHAVTNDVLGMAIGQARYSPLCDHDGGVLDDVLIYRLSENEYMVVVNAANRTKILEWFARLHSDGIPGGAGEMSFEDRTISTVMLGVQGTDSQELLQRLTDMPLDELRYYRATSGQVNGDEATVSRTGYTGEDGFELVLPADAGRRLWQRFQVWAADGALALAGLGARDTLRLEAGMPLYGHELSESINPLEAGLARFVRLEKPKFVGRDALARVAQVGPARTLVGLQLEDRAIARQGTPVQADHHEVGHVTSGGFSPTLDRSIAMALVESDAAGNPDLQVAIRGRSHDAKVVDLPFYRRQRESHG